MLFQQKNIIIFIYLSFFILEHRPYTILITRENRTVNMVLLFHMENRCGANKSHWKNNLAVIFLDNYLMWFINKSCFYL